MYLSKENGSDGSFGITTRANCCWQVNGIDSMHVDDKRTNQLIIFISMIIIMKYDWEREVNKMSSIKILVFHVKHLAEG